MSVLLADFVTDAPLILSRGSAFGEYRYVGVWDGQRSLTALIVAHDGQIINSMTCLLPSRVPDVLAAQLLDKLLDQTLGFADTT